MSAKLFAPKLMARTAREWADEAIARAGLSVQLDQVALPDEDLEVGVPADLYEFYGLTPANVTKRALALARR